MNIAYVTLYTWDWQPIGQVDLDLTQIYRNGVIDRSDLDDAAKKAAMPLLEGKDIKDVHILVHSGNPATPEELAVVAKEEYGNRGPDAVSWGRNRHIRRPGSIDLR
jgi:hypothetical protein